MLHRMTEWFRRHRQWRRDLTAASPGHNPVHDPRSMRWRCSGCRRPWCCHVQDDPCHKIATPDYRHKPEGTTDV